MVGTLEDGLARIRARQEDQGLSDFDKMIIGPEWVRLEMPVRDIAQLKHWADLVRGLLQAIDFYCQPRLPGTPVESDRARLLHLKLVASDINARIRGKKPPGRPKKFGG